MNGTNFAGDRDSGELDDGDGGGTGSAGGEENAMMWTIESGHECDDETYAVYQAWHVVDEEGEPVRSFREREDAAEWLAEQQGTADGRSETDLYEQEFTDPFTGEPR